MATMRFMSTLRGQPTKCVRFDSSPGRAIAKKLGDGMWDEDSYKAELKETNGDEKVYEVSLRRAFHTEEYPAPPNPNPLEVVGMLTYTPPSYR